MTNRSITAAILGFLIPGAGHFFLGFRKRGMAYFALVLAMFLLGLAVHGGIYSLRESEGILQELASLGSMGSGLLYLIAYATGPHGVLTSITFEYGRTFILSAGLMNLLLMVDAWDISQGRKHYDKEDNLRETVEDRD